MRALLKMDSTTPIEIVTAKHRNSRDLLQRVKLDSRGDIQDLLYFLSNEPNNQQALLSAYGETRNVCSSLPVAIQGLAYDIDDGSTLLVKTTYFHQRDTRDSGHRLHHGGNEQEREEPRRRPDEETEQQ